MGNDKEEAPESPEVDFEPIMKLPLVEMKTLEEDEEELVKLRAKLFRYERKDVPAEWKERGTGEVKILKHKEQETVRIVMRRDKTLKICANHYIHPVMEVHFKSGSDKTLVWSTPADYADEEPKPELLAIKFATAENCLKFKEAFEKGLSVVSKKQASTESSSVKQDESNLEKESAEDEVTKAVDELSISEQKSVGKGDAGIPDSKDAVKEEVLSNSTSSETKAIAKEEK